MPVPLPTEYAHYYAKYITQVPEGDILPVLVSEGAKTAAFLAGVPAGQEQVCHAPYTWTIRQVIGHLIDAERVFAYRALWFARGESSPLPGFDEGPFAMNAPHARIPLAELAAEYGELRGVNVRFFAQLDTAAWDRRGVASGVEITVRALAYCLAGHERYHMAIVRKRLGTGVTGASGGNRSCISSARPPTRTSPSPSATSSPAREPPRRAFPVVRPFAAG